MRDNYFSFQQPDEAELGDRTFEKLVNRMLRAGWIDRVIEAPPAALQFHFTERGKARFRALHQVMNELEPARPLMNAAERSELLALVEAWIPDVEAQCD